jgi:hypothetical protein
MQEHHCQLPPPLLPRWDDHNYNRYWEKIEFVIWFLYYGVCEGFAYALSMATVDVIFDVVCVPPVFHILLGTVIGHQRHAVEKYLLFGIDTLPNRGHVEILDSMMISRTMIPTTIRAADVFVVVVVVLKQPQDVDECHGRESHGQHGFDEEIVW